METELNKSVINGFWALIAPGVFLLLHSIWGISIFYTGQPDYYQANQLLFLFIFVIFAYIIGLLIDALASWFERKLLRILYGKNPAVAVLEKYPHWLEDLDEFYNSTLNVSLYHIDKITKQPKQGDINGKKIEKYNISQLERFAVYVLTKEGMDEKSDHLKSKYMLLRNISFVFFITGLTGFFYHYYGKFSAHTTMIFYNADFVLASSIILLIASFYLCNNFKKSRISYLSELFRYLRFYYLLNIKK